MVHYVIGLFFLFFGMFSIWYSGRKEFYERTAELQGAETARKKFRIIGLGGYILVVGAAMFLVFIAVSG